MDKETSLRKLQLDCIVKQKKGIHFILASIISWVMISVVQFMDITILHKNLLVFCCITLLI